MSAPESPEQLASDPQAAPSTLFELASSHPELRPLIAKNPQAYPDLLVWLGNLGDPAVDAALEERNRPPAEAETVIIDAVPATPARVSVLPASIEPLPVIPVIPVAAPMPTYVPPAQPVIPASAQPPVPQRKQGSALLIAFISLAILALVAVGIAIYLFLGPRSDGGSAQPVASPSATATPEDGTPEPEQTPEESPTPTPTPSTTEFPAPPNAVSASFFASPSGNIACQISSQSVTCTIHEDNYEQKGYVGCGDRPTTFVIDAAGAGLSCTQAPVSAQDAPPLLYNTSSALGTFACVSTDLGMSCWNTVTGDSVAFAREGWTKGDQGNIPQNKFPWK